MLDLQALDRFTTVDRVLVLVPAGLPEPIGPTKPRRKPNLQHRRPPNDVEQEDSALSSQCPIDHRCFRGLRAERTDTDEMRDGAEW